MRFAFRALSVQRHTERAVVVLGHAEFLREAADGRGLGRRLFDAVVFRGRLREGRERGAGLGAVGGVGEHEDAAERAGLHGGVGVDHARGEGLRHREWPHYGGLWYGQCWL